MKYIILIGLLCLLFSGCIKLYEVNECEDAAKIDLNMSSPKCYHGVGLAKTSDCYCYEYICGEYSCDISGFTKGFDLKRFDTR